MKRRLRQLLCGASLAAAATAVAQDAVTYDYVDFVMRDNTTTRVEILPDMRAEIQGSTDPVTGYYFILYCPGTDDEGVWAPTEYARIPTTSIREMKLVPNPNSGSVQGVADADMVVTLRQNLLEVSRLSRPVEVTLATLDGKVLLTCRKDAPFSLDLTPYGPGPVIVKTGSLTSKFIVK